MSSTFLPPHLTAQTLASQPIARPKAQPQQAGEGGFEALALKSAGAGRVILPRPIEPRETRQQPTPAPAAAKPAAPAAVATKPAEQAPAAPAPEALQRTATPALDELTRYTRPGTKLDIRV
jgi:hypothetical protein